MQCLPDDVRQTALYGGVCLAWIKVGHVTDIPITGMKQISLEDDEIAIYHLSEGFYATSDVCTHASESLTQGSLEGTVVRCPKHGGKFDVCTGQALAFPCVIPLQTYAVEIREDELWIDVE